MQKRINLATHIYTAHCYSAARKTSHATKAAVSNDGHYEHTPEWLYTTKSGCAFGTPSLLHLAPCRALEQ